jgi:hypothetical protein
VLEFVAGVHYLAAAATPFAVTNGGIAKPSFIIELPTQD